MNNDHVKWPGWEIVRLIGKGSYGAVYEIRREVFESTERAALKVVTIPQSDSEIQEMRNDGYDTDSITETFKNHLRSIVNEYSLMRKMKGCPNIVDCDDVRYIQHDNGFGWDVFIKMELLKPLADSLPLIAPEDTVIRIAKDLCTALTHCRRYDIVHRDIKPQNIFVSEFGVYKLGDFGIAKTVEKTSSGTKIGTYKYMAPEVYNNKPYGAAADIYSLGVVLYWLLNERRAPFLPLPPEKITVGLEESARNRRMGGEPIPSPAHGSPELQAIVLKACAYDPKDRYASAEDMLADLQKLTVADAGQQAAASLPAEQPDNALEKTVGIFASGQDETSADGRNDHAAPRGANASGDAARQSGPSPASSAPKRKKRLAPLLIAIAAAVLLAVVILIVVLANGSRNDDAAPSLPEAEVTVDPVEITSGSEAETDAGAQVHYYEFVIGKYSWADAQRIAKESGGYMVRFDDAAEFDYVTDLLSERGYQKIVFLIGARRTEDSKDYYFVDADDAPVGEKLNTASSWTLPYWLSGEPTYEWEGKVELILSLEYKTQYERWTINDLPDYADYPVDPNCHGFIIEYDPNG